MRSSSLEKHILAMGKTERHINRLLPEYIDGVLTPAQEAEVKLHLQACPTCQTAYEQMLKLEEEFAAVKLKSPSSKLKSTVFRMIDEEKKALSSKPAGRQVSLFSLHNLSRVAAAVVLVAAGYWLGSKNEKTPAEPGQVAEMKQELSEIKEMLLMANLKAQYPSERIQAVNQVESYHQVDSRLVNALVNTLNTDESPNVRLAAANALQKFAVDSDTVRAELVRSLEFQTEPIVQIALINMMVELEEKSAINKLRSLIEKQETLPEVKKQAELGIQVLI